MGRKKLDSACVLEEIGQLLEWCPDLSAMQGPMTPEKAQQASALSERCRKWLKEDRLSVAATIARLLGNNTKIVALVRRDAFVTLKKATDSKGAARRLWCKLSTAFSDIASRAKAGKQPEPIVEYYYPPNSRSGSYLGDLDIMKVLAGRVQSSVVEMGPELGGGDEIVCYPSYKRRYLPERSWVQVCERFVALTHGDLVDQTELFAPDATPATDGVLHRLLKKKNRWSDFPYPVCGDFLAPAIMNRLTNTLKAAEELAAKCVVEVKGWDHYLNSLKTVERDVWLDPKALDTQMAMVLLQMTIIGGSKPQDVLPQKATEPNCVQWVAALKHRCGTPWAIEVQKALEWLSRKAEGVWADVPPPTDGVPKDVTRPRGDGTQAMPAAPAGTTAAQADQQSQPGQERTGAMDNPLDRQRPHQITYVDLVRKFGLDKKAADRLRHRLRVWRRNHAKGWSELNDQANNETRFVYTTVEEVEAIAEAAKVGQGKKPSTRLPSRKAL
jgi:hypothetical protein